jgi:protein TonB
VHGIRVERGLAWSLALSWAVHAALLAAVASAWLRLDGEPAAPIVVDLAENGAPAIDVRAAPPSPRPAPSRSMPASRAVREAAPAPTLSAAPTPGMETAPPSIASEPSRQAPGITSEPSPPAAPSAVTGRAVAGVVAPQPTERAAPSYPEPARLAGVQGTVVLRARVTVEGAVGEVVIDRSAGNADLDAAAVEALRRWRFEPARRAGRPVEVWIVIPIHFSLG